MKISELIVLGPQASSPARAQPDQDHSSEHSTKWNWLFSKGAGEDACGPSITGSEIPGGVL